MASSGLFNRLLDLHARYPSRIPEEDFFTELVAYLFETSPEILLGWLESLGWQKQSSYATIQVDTQVEFQALANHDSGSRPDIRIALSNDHTHDVIFIESKIGSGEGDHQLQRYAEILEHIQFNGQKWLIYITRGKDSKDSRSILQNIPEATIRFLQLRWRDFCRFLVQQPQDFLISEVIRYMKENGMDKQVRFSEADLPAMANLQHPFQLILSVLDRELRRNFQSIVGSRGDYTPVEFLTEDWARFALEGRIVEGGLHCIVGFDKLAKGGNPGLCVILHVMPEKAYGSNGLLRMNLIEMMKGVLDQQTGWTGNELDNPRVYSSIRKTCNLRDLFPSDDIEEDCKLVLQGYLNDLVKIKHCYPNIPWNINP